MRGNGEIQPRELLYDALWDRRDAGCTRHSDLRRPAFTGLLSAVAELIAHHDVYRPDAPAAGAGRVHSIFEHTRAIARDLEQNPQRYDAGAQLNDRVWDRALFVHASRVTQLLAMIATYRDPDSDEPEEDR